MRSRLNINHKYSIFEIGMSKAGEINKLSKLVRPHIGINTNVGEAHVKILKFERYSRCQGRTN